MPRFTLGVSVNGQPVKTVTSNAFRKVVSVAVANIVLELTLAVDRTPGPIVRTQVTATKAATFVRILAPVLAPPVDSPKTPLNTPSLSLQTRPRIIRSPHYTKTLHVTTSVQ